MTTDTTIIVAITKELLRQDAVNQAKKANEPRPVECIPLIFGNSPIDLAALAATVRCPDTTFAFRLSMGSVKSKTTRSFGRAASSVYTPL